MSRVKTIYRAAAGRYRRKTVDLSGRWPNFLLNNSDKQVHIINGKAVFPQMAPIRLDNWHQVMAQVRPTPPRYVENRMVFCEDNAFWPVDIRPFGSNEQKAADCYNFYQETLQASKASAAAEVGSKPRDKLIFAVASVVAVVGAGVILLDLAITKFVQLGGDAIQNVGPILGG